LASARDAFVLDGFAATSLAGVATRAGTDLATVQRLFGDRFGLFAAVFEEALREANGAAIAAARSGPQEGWEPIKSGCRRIVEIYAHPGPGRTILMDARRVLGLDEWYDLDRRFGTASIRSGLKLAAERGLIDPGAVDVLTVVLYGAMTEACLSAGSGHLAVDIETLMEAIDRILRAYSG
jgi:AcrR family transcriptional regulator